MQIILSDHNCEGHAEALFDVLKYRGWLDMIPMKLVYHVAVAGVTRGDVPFK